MTEDTSASSTPQYSAKRIQEFEAFARQGDVYNRLTASFAPSIWEMDDVKRGVLCLLFAGTLAEAKVGISYISRNWVPLISHCLKCHHACCRSNHANASASANAILVE